MKCEIESIEVPDGWRHRCINCGRPCVTPSPKFYRYCRITSGPIIRRPGTHLHNIIMESRLTRDGCGECDEMLRTMNAWGIDGCRKRRPEIIEHLRKAYQKTSYAEIARAVASSIGSGLAFKLNPLDPLGSLVDEAIRRSQLDITTEDRPQSETSP